VKGPIKGGETSLDLSSSSQPLTALALSSPNFSESVILNLQGQPVSRGYSRLTFDITSICGSPNIISNPLSLSSWEVQTPNIVNIPPELSLFPMAIILELLHDELALRTSLPTYDPLVLIAIDEIDRANGGQVDLRDASDLVTPAAVWMALTNGGEITGIPHARNKESNRISRTVELLNSFGMVAEETEDGLKIPGGQEPMKPNSAVETHMDHRLAMVAIILASKVGGDILNPEICEVTHPGFVEQLISLSQP
jgi:5-enolpyruvylshikimate-3-phosphate synthase